MKSKLNQKIGGIPPDPGQAVKTIKDLPDEHRRAVEEALANSVPKKPMK